MRKPHHKPTTFKLEDMPYFETWTPWELATMDEDNCMHIPHNFERTSVNSFKQTRKHGLIRPLRRNHNRKEK